MLSDAAKDMDANQIPAPVIMGAEIVPEGPKSETFLTVRIHATDPHNQKLKYAFLGQPAAIPKSTDGVIRLPIHKSYSETIIWVINEDYIVSKLEKDFFSSNSVNDSEDAFTEAPPVFTLSQNAPNPFNPSASIGFDLVSDTHARLAVYSIDGRKVRELVSGTLRGGAHTVSWDGRDDAGKPVSSGVYLYRLEAGGKSEARKMLLMR